MAAFRSTVLPVQKKKKQQHFLQLSSVPSAGELAFRSPQTFHEYLSYVILRGYNLQLTAYCNNIPPFKISVRVALHLISHSKLNKFVTEPNLSKIWRISQNTSHMSEFLPFSFPKSALFTLIQAKQEQIKYL
jgi:hypothetical protein